VAQTGDPVDLNGNGVFDDHYYISGFGSTGADGGVGEEVFMSNDAIYVLATVTSEDRVLSCGSSASSAYALVKVPLPLGACCGAGGACTQTTGVSCASDYRGDNTTCQPSPCVQAGVCCRGATCNATVAQAACVATSPAGAVFVVTSGACNAAGAYSTPCCIGDYNKVGGLSVQDIFDFLGDWFAGRTFANVGSDGSSGLLSVQNIFNFLSAWFAGGC
jgi:hypothetical protein